MQAGQVPAGYKKTKLGIVPQEWKAKPFSHYLRLVERPIHMEDNSEYELITVRRAFGGVDSRGRFLGKSVLVNTQFAVKEKDFVISKRQIAHGACGVIPEELDNAIVSNEYNVFTARENLDVMFFQYFVQLPKLKRLFYLMSNGVHVEKLLFKTNDWLKQKVCMPSYPEQKKIAEILNMWDKGIELKQKLVEGKEVQKYWLMQKLLTGEQRLTGFDGAWKEIRLGDIFAFEGGLSVARNALSVKEGLCYLHYGDIHKGNKYYVDVDKEFDIIPRLSIDINKIPKEKIAINGDIVFVDASEDYGGITKYVVIKNKSEIPVIAGLHTIIAKSKSNLLDNSYKVFCFQNERIKRQFSFYATGISVYGINRRNIAKVKIQIPLLPEQAAIAEILSTADQEIDLLEKELAELKQQKKALMQLLLTGIVRVNM